MILNFLSRIPCYRGEVAEGCRTVTSTSNGKDFLSACLEIIPFPNLVEPNECSDAFVYLKTNICIPNSVSLNSDD